MKKFISLSKYPGKTGEYFYNYFFKHYEIDAVYEPRGTDNLYKSIEDAIMDNIAGISISMPYKQAVIEYIERPTGYVEIYNSCNTITINNGMFKGHNTDIAGVEYTAQFINKGDKITLLGSGAMAGMYLTLLEPDHYANLNVCARSLNSWHNRNYPADVIINTTALGTSNSESPFEELPPGIRLVIDLSIKTNELEKQCATAGIKYISGREFYREQFLRQFEIYTGIAPDVTIFKQAEKQLYETI